MVMKVGVEVEVTKRERSEDEGVKGKDSRV